MLIKCPWECVSQHQVALCLFSAFCSRRVFGNQVRFVLVTVATIVMTKNPRRLVEGDYVHDDGNCSASGFSE